MSIHEEYITKNKIKLRLNGYKEPFNLIHHEQLIQSYKLKIVKFKNTYKVMYAIKFKTKMKTVVFVKSWVHVLHKDIDKFTKLELKAMLYKKCIDIKHY